MWPSHASCYRPVLTERKNRAQEGDIRPIEVYGLRLGLRGLSIEVAEGVADSLCSAVHSWFKSCRVRVHLLGLGLRGWFRC